jgi:hypothetical protein
MIPVRKTEKAWDEVSKTNPVALGLTHAQTWTIFQWEYQVSKAIREQSLRYFEGRSLPVELQNRAIEIYTRNLFRVKSPENALRLILESLASNEYIFDIQHWFSYTETEMVTRQPNGWPYYIPAIKSRGKPTTRPKEGFVPTVPAAPPRPVRSKTWQGIEKAKVQRKTPA